jgi:hypothetical protein
VLRQIEDSVQKCCILESDLKGLKRPPAYLGSWEVGNGLMMLSSDPLSSSMDPVGSHCPHAEILVPASSLSSVISYNPANHLRLEESQAAQASSLSGFKRYMLPTA